MSVTLGTLTPAVEPAVSPLISPRGLLHNMSDGGINADYLAVKLVYNVDFKVLSYSEWQTLEQYIHALGNDTELFLAFTWRDVVHDGATTNANLGRVLEKVIIDKDTVDIYGIMGNGTSTTQTQRSVKLTLREV